MGKVLFSPIPDEIECRTCGQKKMPQECAWAQVPGGGVVGFCFDCEGKNAYPRIAEALALAIHKGEPDVSEETARRGS